MIKKNYPMPRRIDLLRDLDQVFNEVFVRKSKGYPLLDVIRSNECLTFQYTVPGVRLEDLNVEISRCEEGKSLTVSGRLSSDYKHNEKDYQIRELSSQEFRRTILLPEDVLNEEPEAILKDGLLKLIFKTQKEPEQELLTKKLKIKTE